MSRHGARVKKARKQAARPATLPAQPATGPAPIELHVPRKMFAGLLAMAPAMAGGAELPLELAQALMSASVAEVRADGRTLVILRLVDAQTPARAAFDALPDGLDDTPDAFDLLTLTALGGSHG